MQMVDIPIISICIPAFKRIEYLRRLLDSIAIQTFTDYEVGKIFIRYAWDHITDVKEFQQISGFGEL